MRTILIIGGYGVFGGRIARLLSSDPSFLILVAGRSLRNAELFCEKLGKSNTRPIRLDRDQELGRVLEALKPWLVIDATGPFQNMAADDYPVALASIRAGAHYIDIADARAFVEGIEAIDAVAREHGVTAISGASSVPALSSAIVERLGLGLHAIMDIDIALSASNRATVGDNVIRAILSYVGKPIPAWRQAREGAVFGWQSLQCRDFRIPDRRPIKRRLLGLCDVPDIHLLPRRYDCRSVVFRAGAELWYQNLLLWLISWPVRWGWIDSLVPLANVIGTVQHKMRFLGSDRSAMETRVFGRDDTGVVERRHTIIAESGDGPWIPCLPAALLARKLAQDATSLPAGAYPAVAVLQMEEFERAFADFDIHCATAEARVSRPLYARVLQSGWTRLPAPIRDMHDSARALSATGTASVECGKSPIARLARRVFNFPSEAGSVPLRVDFMPDEQGETWLRRFGTDAFSSRLTAGRRPGHIVERFGWISFGFQLISTESRLSMLLSDWSLWKIPLPRPLAPRIQATETVEDGLFTFDVRIDLPFGIKLISYRGNLAPVR